MEIETVDQISNSCVFFPFSLVFLETPVAPGSSSGSEVQASGTRHSAGGRA